MQFFNLYASCLGNPKTFSQKGKGKTLRQEHLSSRRCFPTLAQYCNRPTQNEKQGLLLAPN